MCSDKIRMVKYVDYGSVIYSLEDCYAFHIKITVSQNVLEINEVTILTDQDQGLSRYILPYVDTEDSILDVAKYCCIYGRPKTLKHLLDTHKEIMEPVARHFFDTAIETRQDLIAAKLLSIFPEITFGNTDTPIRCEMCVMGPDKPGFQLY